ncbi:MAG: hypothetical protein JW864_00565 [Spirochaetes bacterium]|nr:hypothetical protein [Spirochaetota bacterium]
MKVSTLTGIFITLLFILQTGCGSGKLSKPGDFLAREQKYYDTPGIDKKPSVREDGLRYTGKEGTYEY